MQQALQAFAAAAAAPAVAGECAAAAAAELQRRAWGVLAALNLLHSRADSALLVHLQLSHPQLQEALLQRRSHLIHQRLVLPCCCHMVHCRPMLSQCLHLQGDC